MSSKTVLFADQQEFLKRIVQALRRETPEEKINPSPFFTEGSGGPVFFARAWAARFDSGSGRYSPRFYKK